MEHVAQTPDDFDHDNTFTEELSRFSSPALSRSSSCTSITNPFYDGPLETDNMIDSMSSGGDSAVQKTDANGHTLSNHEKYTSKKKELSKSLSDIENSMPLTIIKDKRKINDVVIQCNLGYIKTCAGCLQFLQMVCR